MIQYDKDVRRSIQKGQLPLEIAKLFDNAFKSLDLTKDLNLFDIKKLKTHESVDYFRMRKGKYRAIFTFVSGNLYVLAIAKRAEVYKKWL